MVVVIVTGVPATGKTTVSEWISEEFGFTIVDNDLVLDDFEEVVVEYDSDRDCDVVDVSSWVDVVMSEYIDEEMGVVVDSHFSHFLPSGVVDLCIVTRCDGSDLRDRLEDRGYSEDKISENLEAFNFESCLSEARDRDHNLFIADTSSLSKDDFISEVKDLL